MPALWSSEWLDAAKTLMSEHGSGATIDARLLPMIDAVTTLVENRYVGSLWQLKTRTEQPYFQRGDRTLTLAARPVSSVESVKWDPTRTFGSAVDAIEPANYFVDGEAGQIVFDSRIESEIPGSIEVKYKGGLAGSFEQLQTNYPDLVEGVLIWVRFWFGRLVSGPTSNQKGIPQMPPIPPEAEILLSRKIAARAN